MASDSENTVQFAEPDRLKNGVGSWVEVTLSLLGPFDGGRLLQYGEQFSNELAGADEWSAGYNLKNWESAAIEGALYAFRKTKLPRRQILLTQLSGLLRADEMPALAPAVSIAVIELLDGDASAISFRGWIYTASPTRALNVRPKTART